MNDVTDPDVDPNDDVTIREQLQMDREDGWSEDEDGGLTLPAYYDDSQYDDDFFDEDDERDYDPYYDDGEYEYDDGEPVPWGSKEPSFLTWYATRPGMALARLKRAIICPWCKQIGRAHV